MLTQSGNTPWLVEATVFREVVSLPTWGRGRNDSNKAHTQTHTSVGLFCFVFVL